jgi:putative tryptophan/tyrosine transport system substrate-binding protein
MAILINPSNPLGLAERRGAEAAARDTNQTLHILTARNESEIVATFASLKEQRMALAAHSGMPGIGPLQEFTAAGGLMNYGPSIADGARQVGVYVGKVLKGARPADLPVVQPTKFELAINLKAAKALGLDVPQTLLAIADEVIE